MVRENRSYGSGNFGDWITDAHGLPCYEYLCNQTEDPIAVSPVEVAWRSPTDHTHQIGNDRIVAAASNYGYIQVRQDEGGARFLNDYKPDSGFFGAGLGYLSDGEEVLSTYYPGTGKSFDRFFGTGYLRKQTAGKNYSIDQTIYAPFGDDPVLISEVIVSSQSPHTANLSWVEYWGCQPYEFSYQAFADGHLSTPFGTQVIPEEVARLRRELAAGYEHRFERLSASAGMLESKRLLSAPSPHLGVAMQEEVASGSSALPNSSAVQQSSAAGEDALPPPTFLASLDHGPVRCLTDAASFFGPGNVLRHTGAAGPESVLVPAEVLHPAGLGSIVPGYGIPQEIAPDDLSTTGPESALILFKPFILEAGQTQTLRFIYGYLPAGFRVTELLAKYRAQAAGLFAKSCAAWKDEGIQLAVDADPWVERETRWHSCYLRSGFTYDDRLEEHIVSQGQVYQYCIGYQGAARDPLQHALPLIFGQSDLAKQVLRYTLKTQAADGSLPYAMTGHGQIVPNLAAPSDLDLWLLWLASEYILATRDNAFLEERISRWPAATEGQALTVHECLARAYRHLVDTIGTGKHGLLRGGGADWNEQIYFRNLPENLRDQIGRESESVMNAAMGAYILDHYARMLRYAGDLGSARDAQVQAEQQRNAVRAQWTGKWFKRLWLGDSTGWLGADRMWLDGQPWAILGDCATADQRKTLFQSIEELLRKPSRVGAQQLSSPVDWPGVMPGESKNGGVYDTLDGPLIWALAANASVAGPGAAYEEWQKNSRAHHADTYRDVWYGIWSGPDVYCSSQSDHAGQTGFDPGLTDPEARRRPNNYRGLSWTAWPVMNMHRHAWPLYSAAKLLGVEFTEEGVNLAPAIPRPQYRFHSRLLGLEKSVRGYQGWYAPQKEGKWTVRFKLPASEQPLTQQSINGKKQTATTQAEGVIQFSGTSSVEEPLSWSLSYD
ncbi:Cellobiose phosphorylase [Acidisarcina polymorpha]|uniref:Cellobiose phosphorylase n=1 Tax=Acidisarcina polymorpha TaxID=2211140 RepID=A0A2Z5FUV1_9BACT|nr:hypothetical protein [Acidisarcina polymorpha]AXC10663.1 Cellobiose phosphorylase [Acidisarcina polymorpha]